MRTVLLVVAAESLRQLNLQRQVMIMHTPLVRSVAAGAAALGSSMLLSAQTPNLPTFNVSNYGAAGSSVYGYCSGQAGASTLTSCSVAGSTDDFQVGQGIHIVNAGPNTQSIAIPAAAIASPSNTSVTGTHTYCYVVSVADHPALRAPRHACRTNPQPFPTTPSITT